MQHLHVKRAFAFTEAAGWAVLPWPSDTCMSKESACPHTAICWDVQVSDAASCAALPPLLLGKGLGLQWVLVEIHR